MSKASQNSIGDVVQNRGYQLIYLVGGFGSAFLLAFGVNALVGGHVFRATILLATALITLLSMLEMRYSRKLSHGAHGISIAVVLVFVYLIVSGGEDGTGPLWCYPLTLIMMLLQGFRRGVVALSGLLLLILVLFFVPDLPFAVADYSLTFKIRFVASFVALSIMVSIYEYLRCKSQLDYQSVSRDLAKASRTDMLTGLFNRREMQERLDEEYARYQRTGDAFSVIMLDLDFFKHINDKYGHMVGDELLKAVSGLLSEGVRKQDVVARWGGEEFLVLLPATRLEQAVQVAEKLRQSIDRLDLKNTGVCESITVSLGVQCVQESGGLGELLAQADRLLYEAKRRGRNQVVSHI